MRIGNTILNASIHTSKYSLTYFKKSCQAVNIEMKKILHDKSQCSVTKKQIFVTESLFLIRNNNFLQGQVDVLI